MNILFLTICQLYDLKSSDIYTDLMKEFIKKGNSVYIVAPFERKLHRHTELFEADGAHFLGVKTLNLRDTNIIEKGIGTVLLERQFIRAIKRHLKGINFDLVTYSTPPITLCNVIKYIKRETNATSFLQLKDIFPQNAVDLGILRTAGLKALLYKYFRSKETDLYKVSDFIGCMSPANVKYVLEHNKVAKDKVLLSPNSIAIVDYPPINKNNIRAAYGLPEDKVVFLYGGNLGKPQGIDFLIKCLEANKKRSDCHFLIVGSGVESSKIDYWIKKSNPLNVTKMDFLPKEEYYKVIRSCDVGLIFLNYRFSIPNYPSRLLPYLEYKMPIIATTDNSSDVGKIAVENGYGLWCPSNDVNEFTRCIDYFVNNKRAIEIMGEKGNIFLKNNYNSAIQCDEMLSHIRRDN